MVFLAETSLSSLPTIQIICCWDHREKLGQGCHRTKAFQQVLARRSHFPSLCHLPLLTADFQVSHGCIYLVQSRTLAHSLENAVPTESNNWFLGESGKGGLSLFSLYRAGTHSRQSWKWCWNILQYLPQIINKITQRNDHPKSLVSSSQH